MMESKGSQRPSRPAVGAPIGTSILAMCSLILGVLGWLCRSYPLDMVNVLGIFLFAFVGVICGPTALWRIRRAQGRLSGRGVAIAGTVICASRILLIPLVDESQGLKRERARRISCGYNLKQIGLACHEYAADNGGLFADDLSRLYPEYISAIDIFSCPGNSKEILSPEQIEQDGSYVYVRRLGGTDAPQTLLAYDKDGNHGERGRNELHVNGDVAWKKSP